MKLRLLVTPDCQRSCAGCCNKDWDLDALPHVTSFKDYEMILLTGGEPLMHPHINKIISRIRRQTQAPIILYTSMADRVLWVFNAVDGITFTLHEQADIPDFKWLNDRIGVYSPVKSLRLNVFKGVDISEIDTQHWIVKDNIEWIKDCPLPADEEFRRL